MKRDAQVMLAMSSTSIKLPIFFDCQGFTTTRTTVLSRYVAGYITSHASYIGTLLHPFLAFPVQRNNRVSEVFDHFLHWCLHVSQNVDVSNIEKQIFRWFGALRKGML